MTRVPWRLSLLVTAGFLAAMLVPVAAVAQAPVVKTVPWVASNPLIPHDTWSGKQITLKGTANVQGANIQYTWDFGDGSPVATGIVTNQYVIQATHTYTGAAGTVFTARLTVQNTTTGLSGSQVYFVGIRDRTLDVEVNVAIDQGLWYLHTTQTRTVDAGYWSSGNAGSSYGAISALNLNAFEVNGHLEVGSPDNPYTETVARSMRWLFTRLAAVGIPNSQTNGLGSFNPDSNGNGVGIYPVGGYAYYQGGSFVDAIIASGTPDAVAPTGGGSVVGRKYRDIVQDMVDMYAYGQYDSSGGGGWRYNTNEFPDNSACQWGAIALIPAEREWGIVVPQIVKDWNRVWLTYSQNASTGVFGYTNTAPIWGPYATTPSGMVQAVMDGIGRGDQVSGKYMWDLAETYMRNNFGNCCGATVSVKDYYYGLFSFVKALLLHEPPITMLQSQTGPPPIDWYNAEVSKGDSTDGVARTLVNDQNVAGYWYGHNYYGDQYPMETGIAIIILNRTIFTAGAPVAVIEATPNPAVAGQAIQLNGGGSFHQDASKTIDSWDWDLNNDGTYETPGVTASVSFGAVGNYVVGLRVSDNSVPERFATTTATVRVTTPPVAPTANAGGPYSFCPGRTWFLDGRGSVNPDEGQSEPGKPPDAIIEYAWDLDGNAAFDNAFGATPDVTAFFGARGAGSYLIALRVTDNTAASFPSSGMGNLSDTDTAIVYVRGATDPACACVTNLAARPKLNKADLTWTWRAGAHHYNVYRGTISGGPYIKIGAVYAPGLPNTGVYMDAGPLTLNMTYYWIVREAAANNDESCQSNQAAATMRAR